MNSALTLAQAIRSHTTLGCRLVWISCESAEKLTVAVGCVHVREAGVKLKLRVFEWRLPGWTALPPSSCSPPLACCVVYLLQLCLQSTAKWVILLSSSSPALAPPSFAHYLAIIGLDWLANARSDLLRLHHFFHFPIFSAVYCYLFTPFWMRT